MDRVTHPRLHDANSAVMPRRSYFFTVCRNFGAFGFAADFPGIAIAEPHFLESKNLLRGLLFVGVCHLMRTFCR